MGSSGHKILGDSMKKIEVCFKSGHLKVFYGEFEVEEIWLRFKTRSGKVVLVNRSEVEYVESEKESCAS